MKTAFNPGEYGAEGGSIFFERLLSYNLDAREYCRRLYLKKIRPCVIMNTVHNNVSEVVLCQK